jgi:hypothetical protein
VASSANRDLDIEAAGQLLLNILNQVVGRYEQAGVPLPKRRYIHYGTVAADCEQVTVELNQIYPGVPGDDPNQAQKCGGDTPRTASTTVTIFREIPTGSGNRGQDPPKPDDLTAITLVLARDAWLLLDVAEEVDQLGHKRGMITEVSPIGPSGGFAGVAMTLAIAIP